MDAILEKLRRRKSSGNVNNFYENDYCLENLRIYFSYLKNNPPTIMLVDEAPGYKGCAKTGIPFTSQRILQNSDDKFFVEKRNRFRRDGSQTEASSTIFWKHFPIQSKLPLIWNSFPYHPHKEGKIDSNRAPQKDELNEGKDVLLEVINEFSPKIVRAVGRKAECVLKSILKNDEDYYIRHPSNGGSKEFSNGIKKLLKKLET